MVLVTSHSTNPVFGNSGQRALEKYGKIYIAFFVNKKSIGVDVEGFASSTEYVFEPKNESQKRKNEYFVEHYINNCYNSEELKSIFNIK